MDRPILDLTAHAIRLASLKNPMIHLRVTFPETHSWQSEHRPSQKAKSSSNHPFSGANMLVSGSVMYEFQRRSLTNDTNHGGLFRRKTRLFNTGIWDPNQKTSLTVRSAKINMIVFVCRCVSFAVVIVLVIVFVVVIVLVVVAAAAVVAVVVLVLVIVLVIVFVVVVVVVVVLAVVVGVGGVVVVGF